MCAKLGIALIHARPYQPAGKGKIERFFRTLRAAWLAHLTAEATSSLDTLNRSLWAFVEGEYHLAPHRGLDGRTPLDQWALAGHDVRYPDPGTDLDDLFLFEAKRRVMKDRTVSLNARLYEVDAHLVGQLVTLRYDPDAAPARPIAVVHDGKCAGLATRLDAYANTRVKRHRPSSQLHCDTPRNGSPEPPRSVRTAVYVALDRSPYCGRKLPSCHRLAVTHRIARQNRNNVRNPPIEPSKQSGQPLTKQSGNQHAHPRSALRRRRGNVRNQASADQE